MSRKNYAARIVFVILLLTLGSGCGNDKSDLVVTASDIKTVLDESGLAIRYGNANPPGDVGVGDVVVGTASRAGVSVHFAYVLWERGRLTKSNKPPWTPPVPHGTTRGYGNTNVTLTDDAEKLAARYDHCYPKYGEASDYAKIKSCTDTSDFRALDEISRTLHKRVIEHLTPYRQTGP
ncbi:MAG: hypothetical protein WAO61_02645 [Solirubrobacterales bacterium]